MRFVLVASLLVLRLCRDCHSVLLPSWHAISLLVPFLFALTRNMRFLAVTVLLLSPDFFDIAMACVPFCCCFRFFGHCHGMCSVLVGSDTPHLLSATTCYFLFGSFFVRIAALCVRSQTPFYCLPFSAVKNLLPLLVSWRCFLLGLPSLCCLPFHCFCRIVVVALLLLLQGCRISVTAVTLP